MPTSPISLTGRFRLGDLDLDIEQHRLMRNGNDLKLSKLTFRLLHVLASAAPGMVTKEEMAERVWSGLVVSPETVTQRIKLLRDALQDDAQKPRYVEVVHGQGYRWIPTVEPVEHERESNSQFLGNSDSPQGVNLTLPDQPSIAVLPFDTMGDEQLDHHIFCRRPDSRHHYLPGKGSMAVCGCPRICVHVSWCRALRAGRC